MYFVKLTDGEEIAVQLAESQRGRWRATTTDGGSVELEVKGRSADGTFVIVVDGVQRAFRVDPKQEGFTLVEGNVEHDVEVVHAADLVLEAVGEGTETSGAEMLASPITGIVLDIATKVGDQVESGAILVVVEAMKMENSLGAPRSGTVVEVYAQPGQTVFVGDPLVRIQ